MSIRYPSGSFVPQQSSASVKQTNYGSRGMQLETLLNHTNEYYRNRKQAVIHKKPTPIQIVSVHYPKRSAAVITEAYFRQASTTDYNGVYKGYYLDFEAKETKNKTSFPLRNIHSHQIQHMQECIDQKGIVFFILYFSSLQEYYFIEAQHIIKYLNTHKDNASIPIQYIRKNGYPITLSMQQILDYLSIIDEFIQSLDKRRTLWQTNVQEVHKTRKNSLKNG